MPRSRWSARCKSRSPSSPPALAGSRRRSHARRGCASSSEWREALPVPLHARRRRPEAADGDRGAARPDGRARRHDLDDRRRPAPDVGDAVHPVRPPAHVRHLGRARDDGLRHAGRDRREGRAARRDGRLHRRRRLLPDDVPGARDRGARAAADRRRDREQRLARDGAPVAGDVLRRALRPDASHPSGAGLRAARRGVRLRRLHRRDRGRARGSADRRVRCGRTAVVDVALRSRPRSASR